MKYASSFKGKMKIAEVFFFDSAYFHYLCVKFNLFLSLFPQANLLHKLK